jgi:glycosyltransferase involved in cell wall biosynthesis
MKMTTVFYLISIYEGFGKVIPEAMITGAPVVITDCPSDPLTGRPKERKI